MISPVRSLLWMSIALPAFAGVDAKLVGTWVGQIPGSTTAMTLKIEASGRCTVDREVGSCQTLRSALFYRAPNGAVTTYGFRVKDDELTISGAGLNQSMVFRRATETPAPTPAPVTAATPPPTDVPPAAAAPIAGHWSHPYWGLDLGLPSGWKAAEREGVVLLGSDTEAGLIIVRFMPTADRQMLLTGYSQGLQEDTVKLMPSSAATDFAAGANRALAGELTGAAQNGSKLSARVIGVLTPFGDAAIFLGITTPEKYAALKPRVDALAAGATFTKPKIPPANVIVAGQYYYIYTSTSGSSYSREDSLSLCGNGMFRRKGEMSASQGYAWGVATANNYAGSWNADGDGQTGNLTLTYRNGGAERLRYQKSGLDIVLNGKKYGRFGDGSCAK